MILNFLLEISFVTCSILLLVSLFLYRKHCKSNFKYESDSSINADLIRQENTFLKDQLTQLQKSFQSEQELIHAQRLELNQKEKELKKVIIIVAPHTSWSDFYIAILCRKALGIMVNFVGKKELFVWPFGYYFRAVGGKALDRTSGQNKVEAIAKLFEEEDEFRLTLAPEGTRKNVDKWKTGFYYIAKAAKVPIIMFTLDFKNKQNNKENSSSNINNTNDINKKHHNLMTINENFDINDPKYKDKDYESFNNNNNNQSIENVFQKGTFKSNSNSLNENIASNFNSNNRSGNININDNYSGGQVYFPDRNYQFKPKANSLVMWAGNKNFVHGVKDPIDGNRYNVYRSIKFKDFDSYKVTL